MIGSVVTKVRSTTCEDGGQLLERGSIFEKSRHILRRNICLIRTHFLESLDVSLDEL